MLNVNGQSVIAAAGSVPLNEWAYVTATLSGNTAKVFVNGEYLNQNTNLSNDPVGLGRKATNFLGWSQWWNGDANYNGYIADLKIWNYGRTNEQVGKDYLADTLKEYVCDTQAYDLQDYDTNDNCLLDLPDLISLATRWLEDDRIYAD
jgi:hypothetical protein